MVTGGRVGRVNGLAVIGSGSNYSGVVLPIESAVTPGGRESKVLATGNLGDIAKEAIINVTALVKVYFGGAIKALKEGRKVARASWSGDQISFLCLVQGSTFTVNRAPLAPHFGGKVVNYQGHIDAFWNAPAYAKGGSRLHAWVWQPTQEDMLADDWHVRD